jgi:hypothetical protein
MLAFSRAVELVLKYEDIIDQGSVAYESFIISRHEGHAGSSSSIIGNDNVTINVLAVSAMTYQQRYLVALSARDGSALMHVVVNVSGSTGGGGHYEVPTYLPAYLLS